MMTRTCARVASIGFAWALLSAAHAQDRSDREELDSIVRDYLSRNPEHIRRIIRDYIVNDPNVLQEAIVELTKRRRAASDTDKGPLIKNNAKLLFDSSRHAVFGDPSGDVVVVEFLDYNCHYCRRAMAEMISVLQDEPRVKFVIKELPVLGRPSVEAARVSVAVRMQANGDQKLLSFHQKLLSSRGQANRATAIAAAREAGLDMARLQRDMTSDEVDDSLAEAQTLARTLGITGTPSYVIGDRVVVGAIGAADLRARVKAARSQPSAPQPASHR